MGLAVGSNKSISNSYYANNKLYAGSPCSVSTNLEPARYWHLSGAFIDLVKHSHGWGGNHTDLVVDSDNWIISVGSIPTEDRKAAVINTAINNGFNRN